ncbi:MAG: tetratricopeptide repeat protein, partial [Caldilineaceae bacterium]|nr:tetratricopeptide repeat protein [Caldilineaceae bacterium]
LLIYLAVMRGSQPRAVLATLLWPNHDETNARTNLRQALYQLRRTLGDDQAEPAYLTVDRQSIGLNPAADCVVDISLFQDLLTTVARHSHDSVTKCAHCLERLRQAVALYHNEFLTGFALDDSDVFEEWRRITQEQLHQQAIDALHQLIEAAAIQQDEGAILRYAQHQLTLEPWREEAHRQIMTVYWRRGQRGNALTQYESCRQILAAELGIEPDTVTLALYHQIRSSAPLPQAEDAAIGSSKPRESQDETSPAPARAASTQSAALAPPRASALPTHLTPFFGREAEIAQLIALLDRKEVRLITLLGLGGIGKTRLAQQIGHLQQSTDGDYVFFISLVGLIDGSSLASVLASTLELTGQGMEPVQALIQFLHAKKVLLLLDNFEHLLSQADLLTTILRTAPGISLLVTSREALALQEEWLYGVSGFDAPAADAEPAAMEQNSAVQLFLQRARRADSSLMLDGEVWGAIVRICRLVDGLPLGLELAAAWVRTLSVAEIADEIARDLDFLTATARGLPQRHSSLRMVLEQTWRLLAPAEQDLFCRLALFHNGFTRQAASRVADASIVTLAALVRKSIISHSRDGRYAMHGLLRQFAAARLHADAELAQAIAEKHSRYYGVLVQSLESGLIGADHAAVLEQMGQDIENIRSGWRWAVAHVEHDPAQVMLLNRYVAAYFQFYDTRSRFQEGRAEFQLALEALEPLAADQNAQLVRARVEARLGWFAFQTGQPALAKKHLEQSVDALQFDALQFDALHIDVLHIDVLHKVDAQAELVFSLNYLGAVHRHLHEYAAAQRVLEESCQICQARGDRFGLTVALNILGQIAYAEEAYERAQSYLTESLAVKQALGDQRGAIFSLLYLGLVARAQDDYARAIRLFQEGIQISEQHGDRRSIALGLSNLAEVEALMDHTAAAEKLYAESLQIYADISNVQGMVTVHMKLGDLARGQQNAAATAQHYAAALRLANDLQIAPQALESLVKPAHTWRAQNPLAWPADTI